MSNPALSTAGTATPVASPAGIAAAVVAALAPADDGSGQEAPSADV